MVGILSPRRSSSRSRQGLILAKQFSTTSAVSRIASVGGLAGYSWVRAFLILIKNLTPPQFGCEISRFENEPRLAGGPPSDSVRRLGERVQKRIR